MASSDAGKRLWSLGLFVLPLVAVKVAAMVLGGSSPPSASASQGGGATESAAATAAIQAAARVEWTAAQRAAARHVLELDNVPFGPAPMLYAPRAAVVVESEPEPPPIIIPEKTRPTFVLHAVMTGANGTKALINGQAYQVGEQAGATGWVVLEINLDGRSVVLRDSADGETLTITVQRPQ